MMRQNKIGIVIPNLKIGGNQKSAGNISKILSSYYDVSLILFDNQDISNDYRGKMIDIKSPAKKTNLARIFHSFSRLIKVNYVIKKENLNAVYLFLGPNSILNHIKLKRIKKIISCRDYGSLQSNSESFKKQLDKSDAMICNSYSLAEYYLSLYPAHRHKVKVLYNIVDIEIIEQQTVEKLEREFEKFIESHKVIVSLGRFVREKGFDHLIKSFSILRDKDPMVRLVLIGDGELHRNIYDMVKRSKYADDILLLGNKTNPFKYMKKCDVFALTSINEGFPNVILEAMACSLPIVSTNCDSGPNEILNIQYDKDIVIKDIYLGDFGVLTPKFNSIENYDINVVNETHHMFANALSCILNDKTLRNKYEIASKNRVQQFTVKSISPKYIEVFSSILTNG